MSTYEFNFDNNLKFVRIPVSPTYNKNFITLLDLRDNEIELRKFIKKNLNQLNDDNKYTPLMMAALYSKDKNCELIANLLIEERIKLDIQNNNKETALMIACNYFPSYSSYNIIKALINAGANVNLENKYNENVLIIMLYYLKYLKADGLCVIQTRDIIRLIIDNTGDMCIIVDDIELFKYVFYSKDENIIKYCLSKYIFTESQLLSGIVLSNNIKLFSPYLIELYYKKLNYKINPQN